MIDGDCDQSSQKASDSSATDKAGLIYRAGRFKRTVASPFGYAILAVVMLACVMTTSMLRRPTPRPRLPVPVLITCCCALGALLYGMGSLIAARRDTLQALRDMSTQDGYEVVPALCDGLMLGQMPGGQAKLLSLIGMLVSTADPDDVRLSEEQLYLVAYWTSLIPNPAFVGTVSEEAIVGLLRFLGRVGRRRYQSVKINPVPVDLDSVLRRFASSKSRRISLRVQEAARPCQETIVKVQHTSDSRRKLLRSAEKNAASEQELVRSVQYPDKQETLLRAGVEPVVKSDQRDETL